MAIKNDYTTLIRSGRYDISVGVVERFWEGGDSGKMVDMPGTFLETKVVLEGITDRNLSPIEQLAVEHKIVLFEGKKEITNEPEGYVQLYYNDLVKKVQANPESYLRDLQQKVKERL